jgi:hypothetical protein
MSRIDDYWAVRLPSAVKDDVTRIARAENRQPADQVRHIVERWLTDRRIKGSNHSA